MNVVPIDSSDTLPLIYERGLFGLYHDWCESFSTYPRSYDLLHADSLFSIIKERYADFFILDNSYPCDLFSRFYLFLDSGAT
jgi:hypothetical protein